IANFIGPEVVFVVRFTLPRFSLLRQLTAGCSDDLDEQHADTFCSFFTVLKLIMGFADEVQQLVFKGN
ncbi:hypothetical protein OFN43_31025, partial [Escherichia coli]|nr:hypothetical protein [Escherichia coli]